MNVDKSVDDLKRCLDRQIEEKETERLKIVPKRSLNIINERAVIYLGVDKGELRLESVGGLIHVYHYMSQYSQPVLVAAYNDKMFSFFDQSADLKVETRLL